MKGELIWLVNALLLIRTKEDIIARFLEINACNIFRTASDATKIMEKDRMLFMKMKEIHKQITMTRS